MVVVGRIARPHGLRGQVVVNPETDFIQQRFRTGATVWTVVDGSEHRLTIATARFQDGRPVVAFEGFAGLSDVSPLSGLELRVPEADLQPLESGRFYEHQLVGCTVETLEEVPIGTVARVERGAGSSRLVVNGVRGEILIPLAVPICVDIDMASRRIRVDPPEGLLELNEIRHRDDFSPNGRSGPRRRGRQPGH